MLQLRPIPLEHVRSWLRESFWFIPLLLLLASALLAAATLWIDWTVEGERWHGIVLLDWVQLGGHQGARALLVAVAGAIMTVVGVIFSVTIAVLALATSQFGPRLLRSFIRDRANQAVLGAFLATFLYCVIVSLTIGAEGDPLPRLSLMTAIGLTVMSLLVFVFFVHHVATSIQADHVIAAVAREVDEVIERHYAPAGERHQEAAAALPDWFEADAGEVRAPCDGYLTVIDVDRLLAVAVARDLVGSLESAIGRFFKRGDVLLRAGPRRALDDATRDALRGCFYLGDARTTEQDLGFAMDQLVEVALRAMSPSINDPFTATRCVDRLEAALARLARRAPPPSARRDEAGQLRLVIPWLELPDAITAVFRPLRSIAGDLLVARRLAEALATLARCVPGERDLAAVRAELEALREAASGSSPLARRELEGSLRLAFAAVEEWAAPARSGREVVAGSPGRSSD